MMRESRRMLLGIALALALSATAMAQEVDVAREKAQGMAEELVSVQEEEKLPVQVQAPLYFCGNIKLCYLSVSNSVGGAEVDEKVSGDVLENALRRLTAHIPRENGAEVREIYQREERICKRSGKTDDLFLLMSLARHWRDYYADINTDVKFYNEKFLSLQQRTTILSGQGEYGDRETDVFNFDLVSGEVLPLAGIFKEGADYLGRLTTLANITPMERKRLARLAEENKLTEEDIAGARKVRKAASVEAGQRYYVNNARCLVVLMEKEKGRADYKDFRKCAIPLILAEDILKEELELPARKAAAADADVTDDE